MEFISLKFELLRYGDDDEIKITTQYFYSIRTINKEKHVVLDLGITMSTMSLSRYTLKLLSQMLNQLFHQFTDASKHEHLT